MSRLVIATLLPADGGCGVQTHQQCIASAARGAGLPVEIVTPFDTRALRRRAGDRLAKLVRRVDREAADLLARRADGGQLGRNLRAALRAPGEVVVYAQDPLSAEVALALRPARPFRLATVVHYNVSEAEEARLSGLTRPGGALWRSLLEREARVLPRVDKLLFVSEFMRRTVAERVPAVRGVDTAVIPNFTRTSGAPDAGGRGDLIAIGTLEPRKNQRYLLEVLARARALGKAYTLTLVGDGPDRAALEALAASLGIADQVTFRGYVPAAAGLIRGHRAYAHAARMENFGIVFLEAMERGVPLLATPVGGVPELFDEGVEGRFWPLDDPARGAEILVETLESPRLADMGRAARARYDARFSPASLGPRWIEQIRGNVRGNVRPMELSA